MERINRLQIIAYLTLGGFVFAAIFHSLMGWLGFYYPYTSFLFYPIDRFMDFFNVYQIDFSLNPYFSAKHLFADYFPVCYILFFPFTFLPANLAFFLFCLLFIGFLYWFMHYYLGKLNSPAFPLVLLFFLSYPVLFCIDRGNVDNLIFIIVALFVVCFENKKYLLSSLLLAIAISTKVYPAVFLVMYAKEKRFKDIFYILAMSGIATFIALALFKADISASIQQLSTIYAHINAKFIVGDYGLLFSSSLYSPIKMINWYLQKKNLLAYTFTIKSIQPYYFYFCILSFLLIAAYVLLIEKIFWKQIMLLTTPMILFPFISGDYKLIFLFIPLILFISSTHKDKYDKLYAVLFGLLLIPKNFYLLPGPMAKINPYLSLYSVMDFLNVVIMLVFMGVIVIYRPRS